MNSQLQTNGGILQASTLAAIQGSIYGISTTGNIFYVDPQSGSDSNNGAAPATGNQVGVGPFRTLAAALAACTDGNNDVVYLIAKSNTASQTTAYQSANLNWSKSLTHLIGVNGGPMLGQRSRIAPLSTATAFANLFTVSGHGCLIQNIEFFQGQMATNPSAASTCVTNSGQRTRFVNCQISGIGHSDLDDSGSNSLTITGGECIFQHCYIGLDTVIRATSVTEVVISGSPARIIFEECHFETYTSGSTFKMVSIGTGVDRFVKFKNCEFLAVQNITSAVAPTGLIGITTMNGQVMITGCTMYGFAQYVTADNAYVQMLGIDGTATGHLIGITQGVDAA